MITSGMCPKCKSGTLVRVPENRRPSSSYISTFTVTRRTPVIRYACFDCGYRENWVATTEEPEGLKRAFG